MVWYLLRSDNTDPVILATDAKDEISIADAAYMIANAMEFQVSVDRVYQATTLRIPASVSADLLSRIAPVDSYKNNLKKQGEIVFDGSKADGQFQKTCSNAKLHAMRKDCRFTPMDAAIKDTIRWFVANYDTCRK
jgi:nucleoside-diphosphate-sugar epimerase